MSSKALESLSDRMKDIEQLVQAHELMTKSQRALRAQERAGGDLADLAKVVQALVTKPGPGRRREVEALNRAGIVLLSAHLQGYIEDLFAEAAHAMLGGRVQDVNALVEEATARFSNPHANKIDSLFASMGLAKITADLRWPKSSNETVRKNLTAYVQLRNQIAHGKKATVGKQKVDAFREFVTNFARRLDAKVGDAVHDLTGEKPW